jgi:hypothetical protein
MGYDDSDFYCVAYDPATDTLDRVMTYTTRFPVDGKCVVQPMTDEHRAAARAALVRVCAKQAASADERQVMTPKVSDLERGTRVRLTEWHRCQRKERASAEVQCSKCGGSGHWQNPRDARDKRPCFGCKGAGIAKRTTRAKVLGENGKPEWESIDAGATGVVQGHGTYGTFFKNGYKSANDAQHSTFFVLLDDGREVRVPGNKLRLDREPRTAADFATTFAACADELDFYVPFRTAHVRL